LHPSADAPVREQVTRIHLPWDQSTLGGVLAAREILLLKSWPVPAVSAPAIQIVSLRKSYSGAFGRNPREELRGIDLEVPAGSAFGLIGPNGAGKTTLIKAMLAVLHPNHGSVLLFGSDPSGVKVRARVGYLPERLHLPSSWNPREILLSVALLK